MNEYLELVGIGTGGGRDLLLRWDGSDLRKAEGGFGCSHPRYCTGLYDGDCTAQCLCGAYPSWEGRACIAVLILLRFNPFKDAFSGLAAIQTIIVNANCVSAERQGVMVQAYVQWMIDDFTKAYQRLDPKTKMTR